MTAPLDPETRYKAAATALALALMPLQAGHCELTPERGVLPSRYTGGCSGNVAAVKFEDGFIDVVCEPHGVAAERRGALVFWRTP